MENEYNNGRTHDQSITKNRGNPIEPSSDKSIDIFGHSVAIWQEINENGDRQQEQNADQHQEDTEFIEAEKQNEVEEINFDNISDEVHRFQYARGFTLLMLAAEAGQLEVVQNLIDRGENVDFEVEGESAASLAYARGHYEVLLTLLRDNAKLPGNFNRENATNELRNFLNFSVEMHEKVRDANAENLEEVKSFLRQNVEANPSLKYFYDLTNCSLLKRAILSQKFVIYEFLLSLNICLAPHESMDDINGSLSDVDREELSEINLRISPDLITEPMMILMRNCKLGPDSPKEREADFMFFIRQAFDELFMIPAVAIVLKIVAASRNFKIIFDFKRDSVTFLDPKSEPYCEGLMYFSGKIYVGAKDLLYSNLQHKVVSTIAHELTHYAMFLVYDNLAKPYKKDDTEVRDRFVQILEGCRGMKDVEEIVRLVYDEYGESMQHAELIVRVPHMMAFYLNDQEKLRNLEGTFQSLFDFYKHVCVPEMRTALPIIEEKFCPIKKAKQEFASEVRKDFSENIKQVSKIDEKLSTMQRDYGVNLEKIEGINEEMTGLQQKIDDIPKNVKRELKSEVIWLKYMMNFFWLLLVLSPVFIGILYQYISSVSWSNLNTKERNLVANSIVEYYGVEVKFGELFPPDSKVFDLLSSEQIKSTLKGEQKDLSLVFNSTLHNHVFLNWSNMTKGLKEKVLASEVEFQGQKILFRNVLENDAVLNSLSWSQIRQILATKFYKISTKFDEKVEIYVERFFIDEKIQVWSEQKFETFDKEKQKKYLRLYKNGKVDATLPDVITFDKIVEQIQVSKFFLLSSAAGDGKSTTFRHFGLKVKQKFPQKWIQFVDLKEHFEAFETDHFTNFGNLRTLSNFLGRKILKLKNFELELFNDFFTRGNVVLLWDGVDEVAPRFTSLLFGIFKKTMRTKNFQFVSTRPQISKDFQRLFEVKPVKLIPLSELDRFEFLIKKIAQNFDEEGSEIFEELAEFYDQDFETFDDFIMPSLKKYFKLIERAQKIFKFSEQSESDSEDRFVSNPILVSMISEVSIDPDFKFENSSFNSFQLYEIFIQQKLGIIKDKGSIVQADANKAYSSSSFNIWQVHQYFAFKLIISAIDLPKNFDITNINFLKVNAKKSLKVFTPEQIYRFGILQISSEDDFEFAHRTFAEFFIAQYYLDKLEREEYDLNDAEDRIMFLVFFKLWGESTNAVVSFVQHASKQDQIFEEPFLSNFLADIIKKSFNPDEESVENILNFIRDLSSFRYAAIGFSVLFNEMSSSENVQGFQFLLLDYEIRRFFENLKFPENDQEFRKTFDSLQTNLEEKTPEIFDELGAYVRSGKYEGIVAWAKKADNNVDFYLVRIIKSAYLNDPGNVENLMKFSDDLLKTTNSTASYSALYDEMKANNYLKGSSFMIFFHKIQQYNENLKTRDQFKKLYEEQMMTIKELILNGDSKEIVNYAKLKGRGSESFDVFLNDIIKVSLTKNLSNFKIVLKFINDLPWIENVAIAFTALYDEMKSSNKLEQHHLEMLFDAINEHMKGPNFSSIGNFYKLKFEYLEDELSLHSLLLIGRWHRHIQNGNYKEIKKWLAKFASNQTLFELALPRLITAAYANNLKYFDNTFKFINSLSEINKTALGYSILYDVMILNDHTENFQFVTLAFAVKYIQNDPNLPDKFKFNEIKNKLPSWIHDLVWKCQENNFTNLNVFHQCKNKFQDFIVADREKCSWKDAPENGQFTREYSVENIDHREFVGEDKFPVSKNSFIKRFFKICGNLVGCIIFALGWVGIKLFLMLGFKNEDKDSNSNSVFFVMLMIDWISCTFFGISVLIPLTWAMINKHTRKLALNCLYYTSGFSFSAVAILSIINIINGVDFSINSFLEIDHLGILPLAFILVKSCFIDFIYGKLEPHLQIKFYIAIFLIDMITTSIGIYRLPTVSWSDPNERRFVFNFIIFSGALIILKPIFLVYNYEHVVKVANETIYQIIQQDTKRAVKKVKKKEWKICLQIFTFALIDFIIFRFLSFYFLIPHSLTTMQKIDFLIFKKCSFLSFAWIYFHIGCYIFLMCDDSPGRETPDVTDKKKFIRLTTIFIDLVVLFIQIYFLY